MIKTLEDVRIYWEQDSADNPAEVRIPAPGLSQDEINRVRAALPGLPDDYLDVVTRLDFETAEIQFCSLTPCYHAVRRGEMVRSLLERNSEENYFFALLKELQLYEVANWEGDPLCVMSRDAAHPGEVIRISHEDQTTTRVANSFEHLAIGLSRLDEQSRVTGPEGPDGVELFLASVKQDFDLDDEQMEEWTWIAEMALLD